MSRRDGGCQGGPVSTHTAAGMELARVLRFGVNANYSTADSVRLLTRPTRGVAQWQFRPTNYGD
jgi:hypothetical protein